ncbi:N-ACETYLGLUCOSAMINYL TRANSFERASE COMPONENT FAMILY PROTEIN / GPI1 FAMILY PROTEIN [Salix koriyanagi]|uniref:N-ACETYLGLUCOSAMINYL TRANSFERASE COMPONENT FAMILY PROTEIN / GPI1 FAMILY PROTEIN n=1 Tax=Salix koriyanagi TaxID=2511006 RepID=A0A9Q0VEY8_9ROSI|nr:N-ACETYLGLUCOSAMINYL TRANSFERASE COMPONENT FAMILY PROTEIN / GPI1 FAMILY PROTEIN [Salix koriyanagi]
MRNKLRIWWPHQLPSSEPATPLEGNNLLFGWFVSCSPVSVDVVVAFACNEASFSHSDSTLQEIIRGVNGKMPVFLQERAAFSLLGQCVLYGRGNGKMSRDGMEGGDWRNSFTEGLDSVMNSRDLSDGNDGGTSCGCNELDGSHGQCRKEFVENGFWIRLVYDSCEGYGKDVHRVPKLHHLHWNGQIVSHCNVHVVVYEIPVYGVHHFSLNLWKSYTPVKDPVKKPKWVNELEKNQPLLDLDTVILAINSAAAARLALETRVGFKRSISVFFNISSRSIAFMWQVLAIFVPTISTLFYIALQLFHNVSSFGSITWIYTTSARVFCTTWTQIQIRCCQILYWPIILQDNGIRSHSCVEYMENTALHRHSMWSSLAVDLLLGNLMGLALIVHAESVCQWILTFASVITNALLRSGSVWLMGVPAGFKLNTELAGVLGVISLNAIQIWSTLWILFSFLFIYFIKGLALLGILFGATIPAALIIDMVYIATLHVSTLHWFISLLYSWQIQALAALWRLFRGRKWNPLRQRLDSYHYTVKQHIVGSLLFTPLLLLLPTTSVFYMFFTILSTAIAFTCILIEITISMIHSTPYIKIFLWLMRRRRFPSGIWFEIASCQNDSLEFACHDKVCSSSEKSYRNNNRGRDRSTIMVSVLRSNFLSIGESLLYFSFNCYYLHLMQGSSWDCLCISSWGGRSRLAC